MAYLIRKTKRLIIRPLTISDYKEWKQERISMLPPQNRWDKTSRLPEYLTLPRFKKILSSQKILRDQDRFFDLAVFEKKSGRYIGGVSAMDILRGPAQSAFLSYYISNNFWGQGFGKEAVLAMIDIGFRDIGLHRLEAGIEPSNRRSIFLARSVGLRKEGLKKRAVFLDGEWRDLVMYSATSEEFGIKWRGETKSRPK